MIRRTCLISLLTVVVAACGGSSGDGEAPVAEADPGTTPPAEATTSSTAPATTAPPTTETTPASTAPAATAPTSTEPDAEPEPEPWAPLGRGEFEVGVATITIDDPNGVRPLTVDVWFPLATTLDIATLQPQRYNFLPGVFYESPSAFAAAPEQADAGPFPLVVYSHGSSGLRYIHSAYTEALASHGYVVAAADHTGNTTVDLIAATAASIDEITFNRPNDVRRVIDAIVDVDHRAAGPFAQVVDATKVAVAGHSAGGFTAITSVTGYENEVGVVAADERVGAIVVLAPSTRGVPDERLAAIDVPMAIIVGTDDITTPVDPNVTRLWDLSSNVPAYRIELIAAEHQTFSDVCAYQQTLPELDSVPQIIIDTIDAYAIEGCSEGDMEADRANAITTTYAIQFLDQVFHGGPAIDPTVVAPPDDVIFSAR